MRQLFKQLIENIRFCEENAIAALSPETSTQTLAISGSLANSMSLIQQLHRKVSDMSRELAEKDMEFQKELEEAKDESYDLGAQSVLHNQGNLPWDDAKQIQSSIREGRCLSAPCVIGSTAYIIAECKYDCTACKHGTELPEGPGGCKYILQSRTYGLRTPPCPVALETVTVDGFQVVHDTEGKMQVIPCRKGEDSFLLTAPTHSVGPNVQLYPIRGIDGNCYFSEEAASQALAAYAEQQNASIKGKET